MTDVFTAPTLPMLMPGENAEDYLRKRLVPVLAQVFGRLEALSNDRDPPVPDSYTITNLTKTRTFDCNGTALSTTNDVLGTILSDLQTRTILKGTAS